MVSQEILKFLFSLIYRESGLVLDESKAYLIETRLDPVARQKGFSSIQELGEYLQQNPASPLSQKVVDAMTTNETSFFRDVIPFEVMKRAVVPDLIITNSRLHRIRIWSAGCSTGQEPYSIAMILCEMAPMLEGWDVRILATDIVEQVLEQARAGIYSQYEVQRGLPILYLTRYFCQSGTDWEIKPAVKKRVEFRKLNFLLDFSSLGPFDVIFCRNVLIYFDLETKRKVLERIAQVLSPGGALFLGGAETLMGVSKEFVRVVADGGVYYKYKKVSDQRSAVSQKLKAIC